MNPTRSLSFSAGKDEKKSFLLPKPLRFDRKSLKKNVPRLSSIESTTTCDSTVFNDDDISAAFTVNSSVEPEVPRRPSCLKDGEKSSSKGKKRKVRFSTGAFRSIQGKIYLIQPLFPYAQDLFWNQEETARMLSGPNLSNQKEASSAESYIQFLIKAKEEVYANTIHKSSGKVVASKPGQVSADIFEIVVLGRSAGFAGLEKFSPQLKDTRKCRVKQIVKKVVASQNEFAKKFGYTDEQRNHIRSYSRSLSACDRYWASLLGVADSKAAAGK